MKYIVDANNVAGKLKMLGEKHFDKKLIELIKLYNTRKAKKVILVFDGDDPMGDRVTIDQNITVIYSPKDGYYQSADDKIVEMVERVAETESLKFDTFQEQVTIVTDDIGLRKRLEKLEEETGQKIYLKRATELAEEFKNITKEQPIEDGKRGLDDDAMDKINDDLLREWQK
jgi:predicted RNA-binding protein with PIN domain